MNIRVPILLLFILAEVWWFGAHCTAYLIDINELFEKSIRTREGAADTE
jgi:hypothetical protein